MQSAPDSGSQASIPSVPLPVCWSAKDNVVTFSALTRRAETFKSADDIVAADVESDEQSYQDHY
jgi:hypothetical protein